MAAPTRCVFKTFKTVLNRVSSSSLKNVESKIKTRRRTSAIQLGGVICAASGVISAANNIPKVECVENKSKEKLKGVDPDTLTSSYLIKNAASANVDSATTFLTQIATTMLQLHKKYIEALTQLDQLHKMVVEVHGSGSQQELVSDAMLVVRKKIRDIQAAKHELEILYASVKRLMNNAAEAAYLSGAEESCTLANERLFAVQEKLTAAVELSKKEEMELYKREAWVINETSKREEDLKEKKIIQPQVIPLLVTTDKASENPVSVLEEEINEVPIIVTEKEEKEPTLITEGAPDWFASMLKNKGCGEIPRMENAECVHEEEDERKWANEK